MKEFLKSKWFIAITFLLIGVAAGWTAKLLNAESQYTDSKNQTADDFYDDFFNEEFFIRSRDPFAEMERMRKEIQKQFEPSDSNKNAFETWYHRKFGGGKSGELVQREDENFVYYEINLRGEKLQKVDVKVRDGQVYVSATAESESKSPSTRSYSSTTFQRSFPAPTNVDANKYEVTQDAEKITITFPKRSS